MCGPAMWAPGATRHHVGRTGRSTRGRSRPRRSRNRVAVRSRVWVVSSRFQRASLCPPLEIGETRYDVVRRWNYPHIGSVEPRARHDVQPFIALRCLRRRDPAHERTASDAETVIARAEAPGADRRAVVGTAGRTATARRWARLTWREPAVRTYRGSGRSVAYVRRGTGTLGSAAVRLDHGTGRRKATTIRSRGVRVSCSIPVHA